MFSCHPGHVRNLLPALGFSLEGPRSRLARADAKTQERWHLRIYPVPQTTRTRNRALIFTEEARFRQDQDSARDLEPCALPTRKFPSPQNAKGVKICGAV
jgi:hypothetical protein